LWEDTLFYQLLEVVGVIIACSVQDYIMFDTVVGKYMVLVTVKSRANGTSFSFIGVYGPQLDSKKDEFLGELIA
jgi:hypothetical protein